MDTDKKIYLKRHIGLFSGTAITVGTIIGTGIFITVRGVLAATQSFGLCLTVYAVSGIIALLDCLCYAELGSFIRKSGSGYMYLYEIFGPYIAFLGAIFGVIVFSPCTTALAALSAATYVAAPIFGDCGAGFIFKKCLACLLILSCGLVSLLSTKTALYGMKAFFISKLAACAVIIVGGFITLGKGNLDGISGGFSGSTDNPGNIVTAYFSAYWTYAGGTELTGITEEVKNPKKTLPRAITIGNVLVILVYMAMLTSYFIALGPQGIMATDAVGLTFEKEVLHTNFLLPIGVAVSAIGFLFPFLFVGSRLPYKMAAKGQLPEVISFVHISVNTPYVAVVFKTLLAFLAIFVGDISELINFLSIQGSVFGVLVMVGQIYLRFKEPDAPRPYKVPLIIPVFLILLYTAQMIIPLVFDPRMEYLLSLATIPCATLFYIPFIHFKLSLPFMDKITEWIQLLMQVAPSGENVD